MIKHPFRPCDNPNVKLTFGTIIRLTYSGKIFSVIEHKKDNIVISDENGQEFTLEDTFEITILDN